MRVLKRSPWLAGLGLVLAVFVLGGTRARADVRTDEPGSIVIYPKVIADGTRDTLIALTNTSNVTRNVHCFYVDASGTCRLNPGVPCYEDEDCPGFPTVNETCDLRWQETDFSIALTQQQPTIWRARTGRLINVLDGDSNGATCEDVMFFGALRQNCPGIDPGSIPPLGPFFRGELKCIEIDDSGTPAAANSLKGEAILETLGGPYVSKYNSINIQGNAGVDTNFALELNNTEYNACPEQLEFVHYSNGASDPVANDLNPANCNDNVSGTTGCPVRTEITLIPCTQNFETQAPVQVQANFDVYDEFERPISTGVRVDCWANPGLEDIDPVGAYSATRSPYLKTNIRSAGGSQCISGPRVNQRCTTDAQCTEGTNLGVCGPAPGLLAVVEEFHRNDNVSSLLGSPAAINVHMIGSRGRCRITGETCANDAACPQTTAAGLNTCDLCLIDRIDVPELHPAPIPCTTNGNCLPGQTCVASPLGSFCQDT